MFDNTKPNVILLADATDSLALQKTVGPYAVASVLRQQGFEVAVIHHVSVFTLEEILHLLSSLISQHTLFVGINNFFYQSLVDNKIDQANGIKFVPAEPGIILPHGKKYNQTVKDLVKQCNHNCKIVLGGPSASDATWNQDFDYIVVGYAESSVINLAQHLVDGSVKLEKFYRSIHGPIIVNDSKAEDFDFTTSSVTYCDHDVILPGETLVIEISRGCIFKCKFCSFPLNGKHKYDYIRHKNLIISEMIHNYEKHGVTRYMFSDDTVNDSVEKCQMIYEISQSLPFKLEWWGYIRLDLMAAHPETQDLLFNSGLKAVYFGIETLNAKTAAAVGKGGNRRKLLDTLQNIKNKWKNTVSLHGSFVYGLPYEDLDSLNQTTDFLLSDQNPLDSWIVHAMKIRYDNSLSNGFVSDIDRDWQKYGYENTGPVHPKNKNLMHWKNKDLDYITVLELVTKVMEQNKSKSCPSGQFMLGVAGLGFDPDKIINKKYNEINWYEIDQQKLRRAVEYKQKLFDVLGIKSINNYDQEFFNSVQTFSNFLMLEQYHKMLDIVI